MKHPLFNKVAILGLGLIGGSLALDLKAKRLARQVLGYNRSAKGRRIALRRKACDQVFSDPRRAVAGADLVVLATPVQHIPLLVTAIFPYLKSGVILTDVGSTKEQLVRAVKKRLPSQATFIGGHPVAGTEQTGMASAERDLFAGRWWLFTPASGKKNSPALKKLLALVKALGGKGGVMGAAEHDEILGAVSHLPHILAYALVDAVLGFKKGKVGRYAARSFRDVTRIAASSPEMWRDIALDNPRAILQWIGRFQSSLTRLRSLVSRGDARGLERFFARAAKLRNQL